MATEFKTRHSRMSSMLRHSTGILGACGLLLCAAIWGAIYLRIAQSYNDTHRKLDQQTGLISQSVAAAVTHQANIANAQLHRLRSPAARHPDGAPSVSTLQDGASALYTPDGDRIGAQPELAPSALSVADLAFLRAKGADLLDSVVLLNSAGPHLRLVGAIATPLGPYYFVRHVGSAALIGAPLLLRAVSQDADVVITSPEGLPWALPLDTGTPPLFVQSALTAWARPFPSTVEVATPGPLGTVTSRVHVAELVRATEERGIATTLLAVWFSLAVAVATIACARGMRRIRANALELVKLVSLDPLTELPNRRSLHEILDHLPYGNTGDPAGVGLLFVDLDNFKPVNDTYGHKMGDLLLRAVSQRLCAAVGPTEVLCRLGGDEFAMVTRNPYGREGMQRVADALIGCFVEPFVLEGVQVHTAASVGLAYSVDCRNSSEFLKNADMAMYDAKNSGKGRFKEFSPEMAKQSLREEALTLALRPALANHEFYAVYQPKVCAHTGKVTGFEALLRWEHPREGAVSPAVFIPLAEASGFIHELGVWVLRQAVDQVVHWRATGHGFVTVAVNVSAIQLMDPFFVGKVKRLLDSRGVLPACLQLELTESVLVSNVRSAKKVLTQLRELGVKIAIDDFGTGFSSLNSLQQFSIDYLKVDQSFVREIGTAAGATICRAIISLAHSLGITVIAEGVETPEQLHALRAMGCDELQGYLVSTPLMPDSVPEFMAPALRDDRTPQGLVVNG